MIKVILLILFFPLSVLASSNFLTISDIHYGSHNTSADGNDTGDKLLAITLNKFKELSKNVDFILNLGDLPTHSLLVSSKKEQYEKTVFHGLYEADKDLKPMFYITGNNDSLYGNYQPFKVQGKSPLNFADDWNGACVYCEGLMIDDTHMQQDGYYSSYVIPKNKEVILIALNTIQWTHLSLFLPKYSNQELDANLQLVWLEQQLKSHKAKQLLIAMHVPAGKNYNGSMFWNKSYLEAFIKLLERYKNSYGQISLLTSHTHMDEFRKMQFSDGTSIFSYSTPAISRIHHNNPGMKIFNFDKQWKIKNFTTYYTSHLNSWENEQYQALGTPWAIFPNCHKLSLGQCLDSYTDEQICNNLNQGLFYGVKSTRIRHHGCNRIYRIN